MLGTASPGKLWGCGSPPSRENYGNYKSIWGLGALSPCRVRMQEGHLSDTIWIQNFLQSRTMRNKFLYITLLREYRTDRLSQASLAYLFEQRHLALPSCVHPGAVCEDVLLVQLPQAGCPTNLNAPFSPTCFRTPSCVTVPSLWSHMPSSFHCST